MAKLRVDENACLACGGCIAVCKQDAIEMVKGKAFIDEKVCVGCEICINVCPIGAIVRVGVA